MKIKCLIIDDEKPARKLIENYCSRLDFIEVVGSLKTPLNRTALFVDNQIDLLFLDIRMPDISGVDFFKTLKNPPKVIFTTAYRDYAVEGFELDAVDYLLKPFDFQRFLVAVNKVIKLLPPRKEHIFGNEHNLKREKSINLKLNKKLYKVKFDDIFYIKSDSEYIIYHTKTKGRLMIYGALKNIEHLFSGSQFCRIHRSQIINLNYVEYVEGNRVFIQSEFLAISESYRDDFFNKWSV